jgi:hypothetical protein
MQNRTHTYYSHHWYIRRRFQCGHIFMTRYAKSHTHRLQSWLIHQNKVTMRPYLHDEICKITHTHTSILLAGRRSCCTWSSNKLHFCWWLRVLIPGLQWDHKASWTCTFGLQEPSASGGRKHVVGKIMIIGHRMNSIRLFILKTMIIGHMMKLFILMPGGSGLPTPDTAASKGEGSDGD